MTVPQRFNGVERRRRGRLVAGVCSGIAARTGLDVSVVRFAVLLTSVAGGAGIIGYAVAWIALPLSPEEDDDAPIRSTDRAERLAVVLVALGITIMLRSIGMWFTDSIGIVGAAAATGVALVWGGAADPGELGDRGPLRIAVGIALIAAGVVTLLALSGDLATMGRTLVSAGLAAAGVALLLGPNLARLGDELSEERRARIRVEERAEIAAHLHDGVLQTLTLIQRRADDPRTVATLARRQERELREWLHGGARTGVDGLAALLEAELAAVEDDHGVRIEVVCVGDTPLDDAVIALVAAAREGATNAARHAGVERVDVFVEVEAEQISGFVRDRGVGFDPEAIAESRRGLAESVVGRMRRAGGSAEIRSTSGEGTEVRLVLPRVGERGKVEP